MAIKVIMDVSTGETTTVTMTPEEEGTLPVVDESLEMDKYLTEFKILRLQALSRLDGIQVSHILSGNTSVASAVETAKQGLRDMPAYSTVVAATTGDEMRIALKERYYALSAQLYTDAPSAYTAFKDLDL